MEPITINVDLVNTNFTRVINNTTNVFKLSIEEWESPLSSAADIAIGCYMLMIGKLLIEIQRFMLVLLMHVSVELVILIILITCF